MRPAPPESVSGPGYAWTCYSCERVNAPESAICEQCGSAAFVASPGPLERADEIRGGVIRIVFAAGLLFLFLIGLIEAAVFVQSMIRPGSPGHAIGLALSAVGPISMLISLWTLLHVRTYPLRRLVVLFAVSAVFAVLGWGYVVGSAH